MIDIHLLRKDIHAVAERLAHRKFKLDVDAFNALESERKAIQTRTEELQAYRDSLSKRSVSTALRQLPMSQFRV